MMGIQDYLIATIQNIRILISKKKPIPKAALVNRNTVLFYVSKSIFLCIYTVIFDICTQNKEKFSSQFYYIKTSKIYPKIPFRQHHVNVRLHSIFLIDPKMDDMDGLKMLLQTGQVKELKNYPVSKAVNSVKNTDESCIKPITVN